MEKALKRKVSNARKKVPMRNDTKLLLGEFYKPYNKLTAELMNDPRFEFLS